MKRSPIVRKKPLVRSGFKAKVAPVKTGLLRVAAVQREARTRKPKTLGGMKGRTPTAAEARFMHAIAGLGCIACRKDGIANPWVSVHHIDGRTKPGAHMLVLPLCAGHHQAGTGENWTLIAVHPDKARFEARYGAQMQLLAECRDLLGMPA